MEEYRKIEGTENYSVSSYGNIRNDKTNRLLKSSITNKGYLQIIINKKHYLVHRLVAQTFLPNPNNKECVDHINNNKLDNNINNLRWATKQENNCNVATNKRNKSGIRGVYKEGNKWIAHICHNKKRYKLGYYDKIEDAIKARQKKAEELFGEFANKCDKQEININIKMKKRTNIVLNINIDDDEEYKELEKELENLIK